MHIFATSGLSLLAHVFKQIEKKKLIQSVKEDKKAMMPVELKLYQDTTQPV